MSYNSFTYKLPLIRNSYTDKPKVSLTPHKNPTRAIAGTEVEFNCSVTDTHLITPEIDWTIGTYTQLYIFKRRGRSSLVYLLIFKITKKNVYYFLSSV